MAGWFEVRSIAVLILVLSATTPVGCKSEKAVGPSDALRIGVVLPFSGALAGYGEEGKQGIEMALSDAKADPSLAMDIALVYEDSKGDPSSTVTGFKKLVDRDHVDAVIGEVASSNTLAIAPVADSLKVPLVVPASTAAEVVRGGSFTARVCFLDPQQGSVMAGFAYKKLGVRRVGMLFNTGSDYSAGLAKGFADAFKALGGQIVVEVIARADDADLRAQLLKVQQAEPDAVFVPLEYPYAAQALRQAREMGFKAQFLGGDAWNSPELFRIGGPAVDGAYVTAHFAPDGTTLAVRSFVEKFKARYGVLPSNMAALSYDAAGILIRAAARRSSADPLSLRAEIFKTKDYPGVTGRITINTDGNANKEIQILKIVDGKFTFVEVEVAQVAYRQ